MNLSVLGKATQRFVIDNSPQILTVVGVVGTVSTAVLTGKAAYKAAQVLNENGREVYVTLEPKEKLALTWKLFVPAVGTSALTIVCIIGANHINGSRAAGLATAYLLSEKTFDEYRAKVIEKMGPKKEQEARDEIAQERVHRNDDSSLIVVSGTDVVCYDMFSDRYFTGSMEGLKQAQNNLNHRMLSDGYASLADLYELIGLPITKYSEQIGWVSDELLELTFSTVLSEDQRPCLAIDFRTKPNRRFDRFL